MTIKKFSECLIDDFTCYVDGYHVGIFPGLNGPGYWATDSDAHECVCYRTLEELLDNFKVGGRSWREVVLDVTDYN